VISDVFQSSIGLLITKQIVNICKWQILKLNEKEEVVDEQTNIGKFDCIKQKKERNIVYLPVCFVLCIIFPSVWVITVLRYSVFELISSLERFCGPFKPIIFAAMCYDKVQILQVSYGLEI
jgi:hypothetical protein